MSLAVAEKVEADESEDVGYKMVDEDCVLMVEKVEVGEEEVVMVEEENI